MDLKAFDDYVGQRRIVSQLLPDLTAWLKQHKTPPHMVLYGRPGLGKDHLVVRIGQFLGARVHMYYGPEIARDPFTTRVSNALQGFESCPLASTAL